MNKLHNGCYGCVVAVLLFKHLREVFNMWQLRSHVVSAYVLWVNS